MRAVRLDQAFINIMDLNSELFKARKYFLYRNAMHIIRQIGGVNNYHAIIVLETSNMVIQMPEGAVDIKKVIYGNPFGLEINKEYSLREYKQRQDYFKTLDFSASNEIISFSKEYGLVTIIFETLQKDALGNLLIYDDFVPVIENYAAYLEFKKEAGNAALKGTNNYYMIRDEVNRYRRLYSDALLNARANLRFIEIEEAQKVSDDDVVVNVRVEGDFNLAADAAERFVATSVYIQDVAPDNPKNGWIWIHSITLKKYVYYVEPTSSQWIEQ